ncbi:hypothetical protein ONZ51_g6719 [Trametes cubensis]|uniref:SUZ domain-containing protein n=1 Tax=Trametes cubensis TaxID=1111947 RepID=A0AAD7TTP5_9APHY|nr:hypothetical protein ONZ51_g6719 [Trametes cubensis]
MNTPADSWGGPSSSVDRPRALKPPPANVRDDWDDDEDDAEEQEDPNQVWKEANKRAPMPQVVIAGSSTSGTAALSPPPAALQPVLRILKRPQASATASSSNSSSPGHSAAGSPAPSADGPKSYAEREARYQAARERIFGEGGVGATSSESGKDIANLARGGPNPGNIPVQIAREPKGPPSTDATATGNKYQANDPRGFSSRRGKRGGRGKA